jgi:LysR family transcriptional regulator, low CO2-responsive transcriptional regulator
MKEKLRGPLQRNATLKQLRVVAAVAKSGKITSAASQLGVTAPAVTLQLKMLEQSVGLPLFDRAQGSMRPTDAGKRVMQLQSRIEAALEECDEMMRDLKGLETGTVSIGVVSTTKYFAPIALAAFARDNPNVHLELFVGNRHETIGALESFKVDMAIMGRPPEALELEKQDIGDHPHVIIASPLHRLAADKSISLRALADDTFLLREPESGTRILNDHIFAKADVAPRLAMEFGSNETIKQAVMAGLGIAFISAHTVAAEISEGRLVVLDVRGLPVVRKWFLIRSKAKNLLPAGSALWDFLVRNARDFLPDVSVLIPRTTRYARAARRRSP